MSVSRMREKSVPMTPNQIIGTAEVFGWTWTDRSHNQGYHSLVNTYPVYGPGASNPLGCIKKTVTEDETHPGPPYLIGGPFDSRTMFEGKYVPLPITGISKPVNFYDTIYKYTGGFCPIIPGGPVGVSVKTDVPYVVDKLGDVTGYGPSAYTKFSPVKPIVSLGETLAEFREIPRMLYSSAKTFSMLWRSMGGRRTHFGPKHVANEWLNTQFGWRPFLKTLGDFVYETRYITDTIKKYRRENGKWVKKGGRVTEIVNSTDVSTKFGNLNSYPSLSSGFQNKTAVRIEKVNHQTVWYSAKYKYWLPSLERPEIPTDLLAHLYGVRLSPTLLWNLMPWSWLIDWTTNVSQTLTMSDEKSFFQLVSKDAYIMGKTEQEYFIHCTRKIGQTTKTGVWRSHCTRKQRVPASPYGFDVHAIELSPWKLSILTALGITRNRTLSQLHFK